ncbi:MAG: uncharacterized protein JWR80_518 [Bradyrhizobium sp.]|nr:uncharacterized protein [Bradyrhizobium sp.]
MITPLQKRNAGGLYERTPEIAAMLPELAELPREELVARCEIRSAAKAGYVPSECLLYFIRSCRRDNSDTGFERLYKILIERVLRALPRPDVNGAMSLTRERIRDGVLDRFIALLAADRSEYSERLDFFEIRFDMALRRLRLDAQKSAWREENRAQPFEDEETGEVSVEVERASGAFNPLESEQIHDEAFRSRLDAAIDALPPEQSRTMHMLLLGYQIDSIDPSVMTIAKALGRTEKSVRNYRDRALASLQALFGDGDGK